VHSIVGDVTRIALFAACLAGPRTLEVLLVSQ
jgi:hypothetical protein